MGKRSVTLALALGAMLAAPLALADHRSNTHRGWKKPVAYAPYVTRHRQVSRDYDYARVVDVEPLIRYVTVRVPQRECWDEDVYRSHDDRRYRHGERRGVAGATIAGGLIGGVIGRQIGGGSGRDAMTVVGTLVGSAIANERANRRAQGHDYDAYDSRHGYTDTVRRCETRDVVREEERIDGYRVTYEYNGREYTTRTKRDPGARIRVRVAVAPAKHY